MMSYSAYRRVIPPATVRPAAATPSGEPFKVKPALPPQPIPAPVAPPPPPRPTMAEIQTAVCEVFGVTMTDLLSDRRNRPIVRPRHAAMYLAKRYTFLSLPAIGAKFGGRDHSTVIHAVNRVEIDVERDPEFRRKVDEAAGKLGRHPDRERAAEGDGPVAWAMGALA